MVTYSIILTCPLVYPGTIIPLTELEAEYPKPPALTRSPKSAAFPIESMFTYSIVLR